MQEMKIEYMDIDTLIPYENNPRNNDEAVKYVANSIKEFGFKNPIIIDKDNVVVAGHTRLKAAKNLGIKKIPVIRADDLTQEQIKAFRIADNKVSEIATWDLDKLNIELQDIDLDMCDFGFDDLEIGSLGLDSDQEIIEDEVPEVEEEPKSKYGDIYQLGNHRLMCGDSTKIEDVEKLMNGKKSNIVFTSPPYNVRHNVGYGNKKSRYMNDDDNRSDYLNLLNRFTSNALKYSDYVFVNIQLLSNNKIDLIDYLTEYKYKLCDILIWDKGHGTPNIRPKVTTSTFEFIYVFGENCSRAIGSKNFQGNVENIIRVGKQNTNKYSDIHNATFPIQLPVEVISNFSNKNDGVLDLFGGTGTTLVACEQLNRECYMMELDPYYVDVIIKRWEQFTGKEAVKLNG